MILSRQILRLWIRCRRLARGFRRPRRAARVAGAPRNRRLSLAAVPVVLVAGVLAGWWAFRRPAALDESPTHYRILVCRYADKANLPDAFVHKVVLAESGGDPRAVSTAGAKGLMQIMPAAEADVLKKLDRAEKGDLFDPEYNLLIGTTYLRMLTDRFGGDAHLVLGAYHMGPTRVARYRAANPGISGRDLVRRFAGPATRAYCARLLQGRDLRLPVTRR